MTTPITGERPQLARPEHGRWLAGVCAGIARSAGMPVWRMRAAFVAGGLLAGVGALTYLACWLIIPADGDEADGGAPRGIVVLAQACAAAVGLATLGALAAAATVFGFGWVVVALAATALAGALASWPRVGPGWALLPVAALALPSVAMAAGGVRVAPRSGSVTVAPRALAGATSTPRTYRSGLGTMLVDLRHTALPAAGTLRIDAGIRRTIVALPHDRCVRLELDYDIAPFAARVASLVTRRLDSPFSAIVMFGDQSYGRAGIAGNETPSSHDPSLRIDFHSQGGGLYVRDYPDDVDPSSAPDWPGYPVSPESRPFTTGMPRAEAHRLVRSWRARHREQVRSQHTIDALRPGPCGAPGSRR